MSRFHSHIISATKIIDTYGAGKPLHSHIRDFFSKEKKYGSKDRRSISNLCYCYFRTGRAFIQNGIEEKILWGLFLCETVSNELLGFFRPELNEKISLSLQDKLAVSGISDKDIFPFVHELGKNIVPGEFIVSFFKKPSVFLRIRPGREKTVTEKLRNENVLFDEVSQYCFRISSNVAVDTILRLNKDAVVQDMNSQKVFDFFDDHKQVPAKQDVWDCCAASGGKSILLYDKLHGNVKLTVSDIRQSILLNLKKRFQQAGINIQRDFVSDLSVPGESLPVDKFSIIICDVPCTGSGTWSRNPEQLFSFQQNTLEAYVSRQQKIVSNTIIRLKAGGFFFYITCSVFKKENEDMTAFITGKFPHLELLQEKYLEGYTNAADSMFVAVFRHPNA